METEFGSSSKDEKAFEAYYHQYCYADRRRSHFELDLTDEIDDVTNILQLHSVATERMLSLNIEKGAIKLNIEESSDLANSSPVLNIDSILKYYDNQSNSLCFYTHTGYNLSAEYDIIYHGDAKTHIKFKDYRTICIRAFQTSAFPVELQEPCADRLLSSVVSHVNRSVDVSYQILVGRFPSLTINKKALQLHYFPFRVYIASEADKVVFWIRVGVSFNSKCIDAPSVPVVQSNRIYLACTQKLVISSDQLIADPHAAPIVESPPDVFLICQSPQIGRIEATSVDEDLEFFLSTQTQDHEGSYTAKKSRPTHNESSSSSSEIFTWGSTDTDTTIIREPTIVSLPSILQQQRVRQIACSSVHCLVLSFEGEVFAYGDNSEGGLGTGDLAARSSLTPIDFKAAAIVRVAAASCAIGAHSLALDETGRAFSWGVAYATGLGKTKPVLTPTVIDTFLMRSNGEGDSPYGIVPAADICCGGGFSVILMASGEVTTFGMWSHGRLGLGPIPMLQNTRFRGKSKLARYQLSPRYVKGLSDIASISCGEAHTMCLGKNGCVYVFGSNASGQLGTGCSDSGFLSDAFSPIQPNFPSALDAAIVQCGSNHSLLVDSDGLCWSWGARGSSVLGRRVEEIQGEWKQVIHQILDSGQSRMIIPLELTDWCNSWARPKQIESLRDLDVFYMSAGEYHSAFITTEGRLYLCGMEPVVPSFYSTVISAGNDDETEKDQSLDSVFIEESVVSVPRTPSAMWLDRLSTRRTLLVVSHGRRCFVLQGEDFVTYDLGKKMYQRTVQGHAQEEADEDGWEDLSVDSAHMRSEGTNRTVFEQRGAADCIVISAGKVMLGHQALLSRRSPVLRELILDESPGDGLFMPSQLLIPDLRFDTARALLYFVYTDQLPHQALDDMSLLFALLSAAKKMKIPRLMILTENLIRIQTLMDGLSIGKDFDSTDDKLDYEVPPCTLAKDMGSLVGDPTFSDVRIFAEGKVIHAHRFVLQNRCHYFFVMFRSGMAESVETDGYISVIVPDTYIGFLRLLIFIYTSTVPEGSDGQILEDIMAADRYGITDMRQTCESMLLVNANNCLDFLRAGSALTLHRLNSDTVNYVRDNFEYLVNSSHGAVLREEFPDLVEKLQKERELSKILSSITIYKDRVRESIRETDEARKKLVPSFPLWVVFALLLIAIMYKMLIEVIEFGPLVPFLNIGFMLCALFFGYLFVISK